jgi:hypothetical protein
MYQELVQKVVGLDVPADIPFLFAIQVIPYCVVIHLQQVPVDCLCIETSWWTSINFFVPDVESEVFISDLVDQVEYTMRQVAMS